MTQRALAACLSYALLALTACRASGQPAASQQAERPVQTPPTNVPAATVRPTAALPTAAPQVTPTAVPSPRASAAAAASTTACTYDPVRKLAELQDRKIKEASGLAASRRLPGIYWTLNDSGNDPLLFAFDLSGRVLAELRVANSDDVDWEALQIVPDRAGQPFVYIGEIGDNRDDKSSISLYRLPEPEFTPNIGKQAVGRTSAAEQFKLQFPDKSHDAEALLVHPSTGEMLIVDKDFSGRARAYRVPPFVAAGKGVLEAVAQLDLRFLGPFGNAVTDGSVAPDGSKLVLRTYLAGLEYDVPPGGDLVAALAGRPRAFPLDDGPQGEGISYRQDGQALLTIGESSPAGLYQAERHC
jgi:hypothetical protein